MTASRQIRRPAAQLPTSAHQGVGSPTPIQPIGYDNCPTAHSSERVCRWESWAVGQIGGDRHVQRMGTVTMNPHFPSYQNARSQ